MNFQNALVRYSDSRRKKYICQFAENEEGKELPNLRGEEIFNFETFIGDSGYKVFVF